MEPVTDVLNMAMNAKTVGHQTQMQIRDLATGDMELETWKQQQSALMTHPKQCCLHYIEDSAEEIEMPRLLDGGCETDSSSETIDDLTMLLEKEHESDSSDEDDEDAVETD